MRKFLVRALKVFSQCNAHVQVLVPERIVGERSSDIILMLRDHGDSAALWALAGRLRQDSSRFGPSEIAQLV